MCIWVERSVLFWVGSAIIYEWVFPIVVLLVKQELPSLQEHSSSPQFFCEFRVVPSLFYWVVFCGLFCVFFCPISFSHSIVYPSIDKFWLHIWYLHIYFYLKWYICWGLTIFVYLSVDNNNTNHPSDMACNRI
jgi:hypothetical protein